MQKVFANGSSNDNRTILIRIENNFIQFFFHEQYLRHRQWVEEETERRMESGEDELDEDEISDSNFYWIITKEWHDDKTQRLDREDNWHKHMKRKNWFSIDMENYLNANT